MTKLSADGSALAYSTYLGGSGVDDGFGIAVDPGGSAYVTGFTGSVAFVAKLTADGSALAYSTYLGGSVGYGIAVDPGRERLRHRYHRRPRTPSSRS